MEEEISSKKRRIILTVGAVIFVVATFVLSHPQAIARVFTFRFPSFVPSPPEPPKYNPALLTWSLASTSIPWEARDSQASFIFNNKIWMMGGLDGNGHVDTRGVEHYWEAQHFNDIWTTSDGVLWERVLEHAAWPPRRSMSVISFQGKLWMLGGYSPDGGLQSDIWQSDDGILWTKVVLKAAFLPREGQTIDEFNGKLWMIGGVNYDSRKALNDVWYSENGTDWTKATTTIPWSPRWDHATAVYKGRIYIAGGMDLSLKAFNDVWSSGDGLHWELVTPHAPWETRQGGSLLVFRDLLWVVGRLNDKADNFGPNDVWFSSDGATWNKTDLDPLWVGREDYAGLVFNDRMVVFAGMGADWKWKNDVWISSE